MKLLFLFLLYAFLGWVWESTYVSLLSRRWVNRGALTAPIIPIYGFGALLILWATHPFSSSILWTFLSGMVVTTALEFVTGWVLNHRFHRRLWDYSHMSWHLDGYIALLPSLCWGLFSVLLVHLIHPLVLSALLHLPSILPTLVAAMALPLLALSLLPKARCLLCKPRKNSTQSFCLSPLRCDKINVHPSSLNHLR